MRPASRGERRLIAALMAMASVYGWLNFATSFSHPGSIGLDYLAPGTDWMVFYTSIRLALHGAFLTALDGDALTKLMNAQFHAVLSQDMTLRPWISPPGFLVLLVPFAFGGFWLSYFGFEIATAAALAAGLAAALRHRAAWWLAMTCLVSPAAAINVVSGQVAFLSGACLVGGFALLERRPVAAGLVLGLLTFKPQFFILVPVALLARRRWDAMAASAAAALALALGSVAIVGVSPWIVWLHDIGGQGANGIAMAAAKTWGDSVYTIAGLSGLNSGAALAVTGGIRALRRRRGIHLVSASRRPGPRAHRASGGNDAGGPPLRRLRLPVAVHGRVDVDRVRRPRAGVLVLDHRVLPVDRTARGAAASGGTGTVQSLAGGRVRRRAAVPSAPQR